MPLVGMDNVGADVPVVVKDTHAKYWWTLFVWLLMVVCMDMIGGDVFGVIFMGVMSFVVYYMLANECRNMTQYCLMLFGMMCLVQSIFDTVTLLTMIGGRSVEHRTMSTTLSDDGKSRTQSITLQSEAHSFFDGAMSVKYNVQSVVRVASPMVMALASILSYWSYNSFPLGFLASPAGDEAGSFGNVGAGNYGGVGNSVERERQQFGWASQPGQPFGSHAGGHRLGGHANQGPCLFEGSGQRLGSG